MRGKKRKIRKKRKEQGKEKKRRGKRVRKTKEVGLKVGDTGEIIGSRRVRGLSGGMVDEKKRGEEIIGDGIRLSQITLERQRKRERV